MVIESQRPRRTPALPQPPPPPPPTPKPPPPPHPPPTPHPPPPTPPPPHPCGFFPIFLLSLCSILSGPMIGYFRCALIPQPQSGRQARDWLLDFLSRASYRPTTSPSFQRLPIMSAPLAPSSENNFLTSCPPLPVKQPTSSSINYTIFWKSVFYGCVFPFNGCSESPRR